MTLALVILAAICLLGLAAWFPVAATMLWILALETSPDDWLAALIGGHETIIAVMKAAGLGLVLVLGLRGGWRTDRANPAFAFIAMFFAGLAHGLYPGLTLVASLRSLFGSTAPFLFGFARPPAAWVRMVELGVRLGPLVTVGFGLALAAAGLHRNYVVEQGALRLGATGDPAFLGGFTLIAIYAGLMAHLRGAGAGNLALAGANFVILLLTGARAPLAFAVMLCLALIIAEKRLLLLAGLGALGCLALLFASRLNFIRVVDLVQLGEANNLSNRQLVWPYFTRAIAASPWVGWGMGAGKVVVPLQLGTQLYIGTNAAHNEYLRIGAEGGFVGLALLVILLFIWVVRGSARLPGPQKFLMRGIFILFAIHAATDNIFIATTSSVFFVWVAAIFATAPDESKPAL